MTSYTNCLMMNNDGTIKYCTCLITYAGYS